MATTTCPSLYARAGPLDSQRADIRLAAPVVDKVKLKRSGICGRMPFSAGLDPGVLRGRGEERVAFKVGLDLCQQQAVGAGKGVGVQVRAADDEDLVAARAERHRVVQAVRDLRARRGERPVARYDDAAPP